MILKKGGTGLALDDCTAIENINEKYRSIGPKKTLLIFGLLKPEIE